DADHLVARLAEAVVANVEPLRLERTARRQVRRVEVDDRGPAGLHRELLDGETVADLEHQRQCYFGVSPLRIATSAEVSMFPPETMQAIGSTPARPESATAAARAPAPSVITRTRSASSRIAAAVSSSVATCAPSIASRTRGHIAGSTFRAPAP